MTLDDFRSRLDGVRGNSAQCPAHDDRNASLSVAAGDGGRIVVKCFAGCSADAVVAALGLTLADLMPEMNRTPKGKAQRGTKTVYRICDLAGKPVAEHHRIDYSAGSGPKRLWWERDGKNGLAGLRTEDLPLFGSEKLPASPSGQLFLCEGEKAASALLDRGVLALGTVCGATTTPSLLSFELLRGRDVILWPDNDEPGRNHMEAIANRLVGIAANVRILRWGGEHGDDAFDYFERGGTVEDMKTLVVEAETRKAPGPRQVGILLNSLVEFLRRFVVLSVAQAEIIALWIVHTFAIEAADCTPFVGVTSPEKRSGKTRLLEVLELLVRTALRTANMTVATLFRAIEKLSPTLLVDEIDGIYGPKAKGYEELRALLNSGNSRGTVALRMGGAKMTELQTFSAFGARVLAGIGTLPDTIADRSIPIRMRRRAKHEKVERFRRRQAKLEADPLRQSVAAWAEAHLGTLRDARPEFPPGISDRAEDGAEPLLAIADLAGGDWPERARRALLELCGGPESAEDSAGLRLLRDIRSIFDKTGLDRFSSAALCDRLTELQESGWGGWNEGKGLKPRNLARFLKRYEIESRTIRLGDGTTPKGYHREQFEDAFSRYLAENDDSERRTATGPENKESNHNSASATDSPCGGSRERTLFNADGACGVVADGEPGFGKTRNRKPGEESECAVCGGPLWLSKAGFLVCRQCHPPTPGAEAEAIEPRLKVAAGVEEF